VAAPEGNQFWKARTTHGRNKLFESNEVLWSACCEYFQWVEENPLIEVKPFAFQGVVTQEQIPKMRAMTIEGMCLFLDIATSTWYEWRKAGNDFSDIVTKAEAVIRSQKFAGAAADLLNANIIARDLGLSDKMQNENLNIEMSHEEWLVGLK
jgi:hypothetical protein